MTNLRKKIMPWFLVLFFSCVACIVTAQDIEKIKADELVRKYEAASGVLVVNFWSTWCKPCVDEIPHFLFSALGHPAPKN